MSQQQHTPTPKIERYGFIGTGTGLIHIRALVGEGRTGRPQYERICECRTEDWAAIFVRCVNAHDALVEACEAALPMLKELLTGSSDVHRRRCECVDQLTAALALAQPSQTEEA